MKLSVKRCIFTAMLSNFIWWANRIPGVRVALNEVKRSEAQARANAAAGIGVVNSLHRVGLAADVLLYKRGIYMKKTEDYKALGDLWKSLKPPGVTLCWGGDFTRRPDGNHFSLLHNGRR